MPVPPEIRQQWEYLVQEIHYHNKLYYQENAPIISDEEYDALRHQLEELEKRYPSLRSPESPTQQVGFAPAFRKVTHMFPVYSLDKVLTEEEIQRFIQKAERFLAWPADKPLPWVAEPKIDGLTVILQYRQGRFIRGATRGDGSQGEDITDNVRTIKSIPLQLSGKGWPEVMEVRGEVYMHTKDFHQLNHQRQQAGEVPFVNPRNAAAGSLRQLDASITAQRPLLFTVHGASYETFFTPLTTYHEMMETLASWGFPTQPLSRLCPGLKEMVAYFQEITELRDHLDYQIDGVVYKIDDLTCQTRLGYSARAPRYAMAYKFPAIHGISIVEDIQIQVGRMGTLTPVAHLSPVYVGGVTVTRASLHNADEIARKDIRIGDTVRLQRAGDVIPQILEVILTKRQASAQPFVFPMQCPVCKSPVVRPKGQVAWQCTGGMTCPAQGVWRLRHFVSRPAFDIEGLGEKHCALLYEQGLVREPADLFHLTSKDLESLPGWGKLSAQNLLSAIERKRQIPLHRFIYALGIPQVGEATAKLLARYYGTQEKWLGNMQEAQNPSSKSFRALITLEGIGEGIANDMITFLVRHLDSIKTLLASVQVTPHTSSQVSSILEGKSIVFTGSLGSMTRAEAKQKAEEKGAHVLSAISHLTNYVVIGDKAGKKLQQARDLGLTILTEAQWLDLISS